MSQETRSLAIRASILTILRSCADEGNRPTLAPLEEQSAQVNLLQRLGRDTAGLILYDEVFEDILQLFLIGRISIMPDKWKPGVLHLKYRYSPEDSEEAKRHREQGFITA
ncbi:hypothetical protein IH982_00970 [Patescibacteria group bacterium]|nr:hypothetical protein [Patescibacteria group bacterium]